MFDQRRGPVRTGPLSFFLYSLAFQLRFHYDKRSWVLHRTWVVA